jgi:hypothetical protein
LPTGGRRPDRAKVQRTSARPTVSKSISSLPVLLQQGLEARIVAERIPAGVDPQ